MNLYWSIYKNLEKELVKLADVIHFDDQQISVYSIHILDLLIRTAVEIEAISKHLYEINGGNMSLTDDNGKPRSLYFDSDCIQELDVKWHITKKVVNVVSPNFYFNNPENIVLRPLKNCNKQGSGTWKKAYQAVKHNRVECLKFGNIGNLIKAMAALYILNIYNNGDDKIDDINIGATITDLSLGSSVFSVNVFKATGLSISEHMDDSNILQHENTDPYRTRDATVLIDKYTEESYIEMHKKSMADLEITQKNFEQSTLIKDFLIKHPEFSNRSMNEICIACGEENERIRLGIESENEQISAEDKEKIMKAGHKMLFSIFSFNHSVQGKKARRELIINKLQSIYPSI